METATLSTVDQFKELVRQEWSDPATVAGWRRWFPKMLVQFQTGTDLLLQAASLEPGMHVLDLASGSGDPALALAAAVGPTGRVTATDSSTEMLALAEANARAQGLTNLTFRQADAQALPFPDQHFDRVTSKLGVMYFVDCAQALREVRRVLKPDGRVALLAWGPPEQSPYIQAALGPILQRAQLPPPPPDAPQPFRFAAHGALTAELDRAGFRQIQEDTHVDSPAVAGSAGGTLAAPLRHRRAVPSGHRRSRPRRTRAGDRRGARRVAAVLRWGADEYPGGHRGCVGDALTSAERGPLDSLAWCGRQVLACLPIAIRRQRRASRARPTQTSPPRRADRRLAGGPSFPRTTSTATWRPSSTSAFVRDWVRELYAERGRPSIDPVVFFKLQLVMFFEGIRSERQLIETASLNLAHRWLPRAIALDEPLPDHSSLTRIRQRLGIDDLPALLREGRRPLPGSGLGLGPRAVLRWLRPRDTSGHDGPRDEEGEPL